MLRLRGGLLIAATVVAGWLAPSLWAAANREESVAETLDRYLAGDYEGSVRSALDLDRATFIRDYGRQADDWVDAGAPADRARRRIAAATFALEFAFAAKAPEDQFWNPGWFYSKVLVEHACHLIRAAPDVHPAERTWFYASIKLALAARDRNYLGGRPPPITGPDADLATRDAPPEGGSGISYLSRSMFSNPVTIARQFAASSGLGLRDHVSDALSRVDDPRYRLALVGDDAPLQPPYRAITGAGIVKELRAPDWMDELRELLQYPEIRAEVHLRLGLTALRVPDGNAAVGHLRQVVDETDDPVLVYVSQLVLGQVLEMNDRVDEAVAAYRRAVAWRPYSSAALPLAALLFATGERDEAMALTRAAVTVDDPSDDPVLLLGTYDISDWPALIADLRESFR